MRKIEREMIEAIKAKKNYSNDNTRVAVSEDGNYIKVELHGNLIAQIWVDSKLMLSDCGYQTKTTKSRLNCILSHFNLPTIYQQKYRWYTEEGKYIWYGSKTFNLKEEESIAQSFENEDNTVAVA